jgi:serine/threonine protein kinase
MAPEVVVGADYDTHADIWSLGITLIEMAEGRPPLSRDIPNPMRAMFKIPFLEPPKLADPAKWSPALVDFVAATLIKEPAKRPSASQLLEHAWITDRVKDRASFMSLLVEVKRVAALAAAADKPLPTPDAATMKPVKPKTKVASSPALPAISDEPTGTLVVHDTIVEDTLIDTGAAKTVKASDVQVAKSKTLFSRFKRSMSKKAVKPQDANQATSAGDEDQQQTVSQSASTEQLDDNKPTSTMHAVYITLIIVLTVLTLYYRSQNASCEISYSKLKASQEADHPPISRFCSYLCR